MAGDAADDAGTTDEVLPEPEPIEDDAASPVEVIDVEPREPDPSPESSTRAALAVIEPEDDRPRHLVPGRDLPIIPERNEMRDLAAMAVTLAGAKAVPAPLRDAPNDVFQVLMTARDNGVAVTTAMREFHVIDGRVTMSPKVKLAMVHERGHRDGWKVWPCSPELDPETNQRKPCRYCGSETGNTAERAAWHATRQDYPGTVFSSEFTMEMARQVPARVGGRNATLADKDNWQAYPQRMVSWRALGYLLDDVFPEVGTGLYSPDELGGMTDEEGNYIDVAETEPLPGTKAPRGHHAGEPPNPKDALLSVGDPDTYRAIQERIEALLPAARDELKAQWGQMVGEPPAPRIPPLNRCTGWERQKIMALLGSIEKRQAKGEWGDPPAADQQPPEAPQDGGDGAAAADAPADAPEASSDDDSALDVDADGRDRNGTCLDCFAGPGEPHGNGCAHLPAPEPEPALSIADRVKAMEFGEVLRQLDERKDRLPPHVPSTPKAQRQLLIALLEAEAVRPVTEDGALPLE